MAIVPALLYRFSSRAGHRLFDDTLSARAYRAPPCPRCVLVPRIVQGLREINVQTGMVANADARICALLFFFGFQGMYCGGFCSCVCGVR